MAVTDANDARKLANQGKLPLKGGGFLFLFLHFLGQPK
jgi:hypothetical protein